MMHCFILSSQRLFSASQNKQKQTNNLFSGHRKEICSCLLKHLSSLHADNRTASAYTCHVVLVSRWSSTPSQVSGNEDLYIAAKVLAPCGLNCRHPFQRVRRHSPFPLQRGRPVLSTVSYVSSYIICPLLTTTHRCSAAK
jgi:hypothetical protein